MFWPENKHRKRGRSAWRGTRKAVVIATIVSFLLNICGIQPILAAIPDILPYPPISVYRDLGSEMREGTFKLPEAMGYVQESFVNGAGKIVVHIQDAHCDYYAQKTIKKIIEYFKEEYGVTLACLEGGVGGYDLSSFTDIEDAEARKKVVDFFLRQGTLNAAEAAAAEKPGSLLLRGVENEELYRKNLAVFRRNAKHKRKIDGYLARLSNVIENLKRNIYSDELFRMDQEYGAYKRKEITFKEYLSYLVDLAKARNVPLEDQRNIYLLKQVLDYEDKIDFRKANAERDAFIEGLKGKISRVQFEELIGKTLEYKEGRIKQADYYNYLIEAGNKEGAAITDYPSLKEYITYISMFDSIDKTDIKKDLAGFEDLLREALSSNDEQKKMLRVSKAFMITQKAFGFSMTKEDFEHLQTHPGEFNMREILDFLGKEAPRYKITAEIPAGALELNDRLDDIKDFYVFSFERDDVFIERIKAETAETGYDNLVLFTGGFHADNITDLLKKEGISYITILPRFRDKKEYTAPYFELLGGAPSDLGRIVDEALASAASNIQVASMWNRLGLEVDGEAKKNAADVQVELVKALIGRGEALLGVAGTGRSIRFKMDQKGNVTYAIETTGENAIEDVRITDLENLSYSDHEKIIDREIERARDEGRLSDLASDSGIMRDVADFFDAIGQAGVASAIRRGEVPVKEAKGIQFFNGHASWRGVYVKAELGDKEKAAVIAHEVGAYFRQPHDVNKKLEEIYGKHKIGESAREAARETSGLSRLQIDTGIKLTEAGPVAGRDYTQAIEAYKDLIEDLTRDIGGETREARFLAQGVKRLLTTMAARGQANGVQLVAISRAIMDDKGVQKMLIASEETSDFVKNDPEVQSFLARENGAPSENYIATKGVDPGQITTLMEQAPAKARDDLNARDWGSLSAVLADSETTSIIDNSVLNPGGLLDKGMSIVRRERGVGEGPGAGETSDNDFIKRGDAKEKGGYLEVKGREKIEITSTSPEKMTSGMIAAMRSRSEAIPFIESGKLTDFFKNLEIYTIDDNARVAGYVDVSDATKPKLYVSETIRAASEAAPEMIPMIVLSEIARSGVSARMAKAIGLKEASPVLLAGLSKDKADILTGIMIDLEQEEKAPSLDSLRNSAGNRLTPEEYSLVAGNLNRIKGVKSALAFGLIEQLFGEVGAGEADRMMDTVRTQNGSSDKLKELADRIMVYHPLTAVSFADIMAGRAHAQYLGAKIMDIMRPEATKAALRYAREQGIFAIHYGKDEHSFIFPDTYTDSDIARFFFGLSEELAKGLPYSLYGVNIETELTAEEVEALEALDGVTLERIYNVEGEEYAHILVRNDALDNISRNVVEKLKAHEKNIRSFQMPAGVVKFARTPADHVPFDKVLGAAEKKAAPKWKEEELAGLGTKELKEIWDRFGEPEKELSTLQEILRDSAYDAMDQKYRDERGIKTPEDITFETAVKFGLPTYNKDILVIEQIDTQSIEAEEDKYKLIKEDMRQRMEEVREEMRKEFSARIAENVENASRFTSLDPYTSYEANDVLEELLASLMEKTPEELAKLDRSERVFMIRGPPIDSEIIVIDDEGRIKRISVDVMFHAENLPEAVRKNVIDRLIELMKKSGRASDYLVGNPYRVKDLQRALETGAIDEKTFEDQLRNILEDSPRVFPFKTLNSYLEDHTLADDYIFAVKVALYGSLKSEFLKRGEDGKYLPLKEDWEGVMLRDAAKAANGSLLDTKDFMGETEGKPPLQMMLETHVVEEDEFYLNARKGTTKESLFRDPLSAARGFLEKGNAMRAVRDPVLIAEDGEIMHYFDEGKAPRLAGRLRRYKEVEGAKYAHEYNIQKKGMLNQVNSVDRKNTILMAEKKKKQAVIEARRARESVDGLYAASQGVLSNVKDGTTPIVVFLPCSMFDQSQKKGVSSKVRRELEQKYDTKNLQVMFYDGKAELKEGKNRMKKILDRPGAAAVIFCDAETGIHPKGDPGKDLFPGQTAYYVNEQIDKSAAVTAPLVGTHVAFALGLRDWMAGNRSPELRDGMSALITQMTGSDANILEKLGQVDGVERLLEQMLREGVILPIRKIDFETLREQIEAEEAALKSL